MHLGTGGASTRSFVLAPGRSFPSPVAVTSPPGRLTSDGTHFAGASVLPVPNLVHQSRRVCKIVRSDARVRATAPPAGPRYTRSSRQKVTHVRGDTVPPLCARCDFAQLAMYLVYHLTMRRAFKSAKFAYTLTFPYLFSLIIFFTFS